MLNPAYINLLNWVRMDPLNGLPTLTAAAQRLRYYNHICIYVYMYV